jgi:hypothetical protein
MVPSRWELGPAVDACFGARGEGKAGEFGAAIQTFVVAGAGLRLRAGSRAQIPPPLGKYV